MPPFAVSLRPSKRRRAIVCLTAAVALAAACSAAEGSLKTLLSAAVLLSSAWAWREPQPRIVRIETDAAQRAILFTDDRAEYARLLSGSLVSPWLMLLKWQTGSRILHQALFPDMTDADGWRRLTVWARFCRNAAAGGDDGQAA